MIYKKDLPVRYKTDILVVGGGPSGVAAAVTAARLGKKVLIIENNGCFGGVGTTGLVPSFAQFTDGKDFLVGGVGKEIRDLTIGEYCDYKRFFYTFSVEKLKTVYDNIVTAEKNIDILLNVALRRDFGKFIRICGDHHIGIPFRNLGCGVHRRNKYSGRAA